jgi:N,N'-diacetyllegionaminate synthase
MDIVINNKKIGNRCKEDNNCFIIAEIGVNHILEQDDMAEIGAKTPLEVAFKMIDAAKEAGVDAVKFQSFKAENLQFKGTKKPAYQNDTIDSTKEEKDYYKLIKSLETTNEDQIKIADYCKEKGIIFFSTPYDYESTDFLNNVINVPLFKLASIESNNHLFIRYVAKKGKPILLSTGLSDMENIRHIIEIARKDGFSKKLVILQCTSNYPTKPKDINLNVLKTYMKEFPDIQFGFSDHSQDDTASIGAVAIGAVVVEKHFTLNKNFKGPDHAASLETENLKKWVNNIRNIEISMGSYKKSITDVERNNMTMMKYLVITPQKKGTIINENMLKTMRTGNGILPIDNNLEKVIGKKINKDINELTPLTWDMIE